MSFAARVASVAQVPKDRIYHLAGGSLSEILLVRSNGGEDQVAKGGPLASAEAAMLRILGDHGLPVPAVEAEHEGIILISHVPNDRRFDDRAWADIGRWTTRLHAVEGKSYGWPTDYAFGSVELDNRETADWIHFWARRLITTASLLDRPWREKVDRVVEALPDLLPREPRPVLLHGDLWSGNLLVKDGRLAAFIDPACHYGHSEVDMAMLTLFDTPAVAFAEHYGELEPGWEERRPVYQMFPALVHLRLFGAGYAGLVDRLVNRVIAGDSN